MTVREVTYRPAGDYQIPEVEVSEKTYEIGKYGMMRRTFLKNNRRALYSIMLMKGKLLEHLEEVNRTAAEQIQDIVEQMAKEDGVTELMKAKDPMRWTGLMENYRHSAEEMILPELVYN